MSAEAGDAAAETGGAIIALLSPHGIGLFASHPLASVCRSSRIGRGLSTDHEDWTLEGLPRIVGA